MALNSKDARKQAEYKIKRYKLNYMNRFSSLFHNSIIVENAPKDLPKRYLLRELLNKGGIAFDKQSKLYLPYNHCQIDQYGLPKEYELYGYLGLVVRRKADEVVILRANDLKEPLSDYLDIQTDKIVNLDLAIEQNIEAIKTMTIAEVPDQKTLLSVANIMESRSIGSTMLILNKSSNLGTEIKVQSTGAQYLVDKLLEARKEIINETLSAMGIGVANVDKRERVQGMEIQASEQYAVDCISTLVETFNHDAEEGGLEIRLKANTSLMEDRDKAMEEQKDVGMEK